MAFNWRQETDNPVDAKIYPAVLQSLTAKTVAIPGSFDYLLRTFNGKKILDIGVVEHDISHYNDKQNWKHGQIKAVAAECLGIDIVQPMVDQLNRDGFECLCVDATSDFDIGRRFDFVHIGDVIEHVSDAVKLLEFAARHISSDGKIVVTTPNPYYFEYLWRVLMEGKLVANYEHVSWVGESMALELASRAGISLEKIWRPVSKNLLKRKLQMLNLGFLCSKFYFVFSKI
jgi:2-polyprenyl-3-methyl-5-hydroxy-6-metoxy-1,4-benzoquinol methylase